VLFDTATNNSESAAPSFLWKGIFHAHTDASPDCTMTTDTIIERCLDEGVDVYTVTDHGTLDGAHRLADRAPFRVIVGEEIQAVEGGDLIGLFLRRPVSPRLPARDVIRAIREQGGLVYIPHPFDTSRKKQWPASVRAEVLNEADIVEVFNARNVFSSADRQAAAFALAHGKTAVAGADAHRPSEIGQTLVYLPPFATATELLKSLERSEFRCVRTPRWRTLVPRLLSHLAS